LRKSGKPLKILYLVPTVGETSSPYNEYACVLSGKYDIALCSYTKATVTTPPEIQLFEGDGSVAGFFRALKKALNGNEYDIIHGHMAASGILFLLANILHRRPLRSTVFTVHNCYQNHRFRNRLLLLPIFVFFQRVVCCSQAALDSFPALYKYVAGNRLTSIQNGVNMSRVDLILSEQVQASKPVPFTIISVGRLIKIKNPQTVLKAFHKFADSCRLVFIGEGELKDTVFASARELYPEQSVEFTGLIPRNAVYQDLAQADVFISTSYGEGLPVAALEAMACGCPVILSDIQPHRELAVGADFIPLIPADDAEMFAREIKRLKGLSAKERKMIGAKCREWVEDNFSLTAMHRQYIALYEQLCI
jgi:glycosyltransferase involved in cell wall biosynthesis